MADAAQKADTRAYDGNVVSLRKIHPTRFGLTEHKRNVWQIVPEDGTAYKSLLQPEYWAHVADWLRPTDRIEVVAEDGSYFAELIVRATGAKSAKVAELRKVDLDPEETAMPGVGYDVKWHGPHDKFVVLRQSDGEKVNKGFETREQGLQWLSVNLKSLTA